MKYEMKKFKATQKAKGIYMSKAIVVHNAPDDARILSVPLEEAREDLLDFLEEEYAPLFDRMSKEEIDQQMEILEKISIREIFEATLEDCVKAAQDHEWWPLALGLVIEPGVSEEEEDEFIKITDILFEMPSDRRKKIFESVKNLINSIEEQK